MIKDHLEQLQSRLELEPGLPEATRAELLQLVAAVKQEHGLEEDVETESEPAAEDDQPGLSRLMASVEGLEASHPELAASINQVAITLSKMGI
jgi:hypothetical protein